MSAGERKLADIGILWSEVSHTIFVVLVPFDAIIERENERNYAASLRTGAGGRAHHHHRDPGCGSAGRPIRRKCMWLVDERKREEKRRKIALFVAAENVYLICQTF